MSYDLHVFPSTHALKDMLPSMVCILEAFFLNSYHWTVSNNWKQTITKNYYCYKSKQHILYVFYYIHLSCNIFCVPYTYILLSHKSNQAGELGQVALWMCQRGTWQHFAWFTACLPCQSIILPASGIIAFVCTVRVWCGAVKPGHNSPLLARVVLWMTVYFSEHIAVYWNGKNANTWTF